jgi:hypothetical protein
MHIDINLALTIATGVLIAGFVKHVIVITFNRLYWFSNTSAPNDAGFKAPSGSKVSSKH